jgi:hypothetical protein
LFELVRPTSGDTAIAPTSRRHRADIAPTSRRQELRAQGMNPQAMNRQAMRHFKEALSV